jgi:hypothetical protein
MRHQATPTKENGGKRRRKNEPCSCKHLFRWKTSKKVAGNGMLSEK